MCSVPMKLEPFFTTVTCGICPWRGSDASPTTKKVLFCCAHNVMNFSSPIIKTLIITTVFHGVNASFASHHVAFSSVPPPVPSAGYGGMLVYLFCPMFLEFLTFPPFQMTWRPNQIIPLKSVDLHPPNLSLLNNSKKSSENSTLSWYSYYFLFLFVTSWLADLAWRADLEQVAGDDW